MDKQFDLQNEATVYTQIMLHRLFIVTHTHCLYKIQMDTH